MMFIIYILLILGSIIFFLYYQNNHIKVRKILVESKKLPSSFDNFKILQISDLHNKSFGFENKKLINKIFKINPDILVITGDLVDRNKYKLDVAIKFIEKLENNFPIYYCPGNHEFVTKDYHNIRNQLEKNYVNVLDNRNIKLYKNDDFIYISGIDDPYFYKDGTRVRTINKHLKNIQTNDDFNILLSHRSEYFNIYKQYGFDLVFSGHAHGGQVRLFKLGGLYAPNQGFFPEFDCGLFFENGTNMIVSPGLGNSTFPLRLFNYPSLMVCVLNKK